MKKPWSAPCLAVIGLLGFLSRIGQVQGEVIYNQTFSGIADGTNITAAGLNVVKTAASLDAFGQVNGERLRLQTQTTGNGQEYTFRNFGSATLGSTIGDKVVLSFSYARDAGAITASNGSSFRFGFSNSQGTQLVNDYGTGAAGSSTQNQSGDRSIYVQYGLDNLASNGILFKQPADSQVFLAGPGISVTGNVANSSPGVPQFPWTGAATNNLINNPLGTSHVLTLELERTGANTGTYRLLRNGVTDVSVSADATQLSYLTSFDQISFGTTGTTGLTIPFQYVDNIRLETITAVPEPTSVLLLGAASSSIWLARRRKSPKAL